RFSREHVDRDGTVRDDARAAPGARQSWVAVGRCKRGQASDGRENKGGRQQPVSGGRGRAYGIQARARTVPFVKFDWPPAARASARGPHSSLRPAMLEAPDLQARE